MVGPALVLLALAGCDSDAPSSSQSADPDGGTPRYTGLGAPSPEMVERMRRANLPEELREHATADAQVTLLALDCRRSGLPGSDRVEATIRLINLSSQPIAPTATLSFETAGGSSSCRPPDGPRS